MGKASRWFKGLLGFKKQPDAASATAKPPPKRRWSFVKSYREKQPSLVSGSGDLSVRRAPHSSGSPAGDDEESKHAIAVAAATAAVAEAAVAAAHAAAAVVRLTSGSCRPADAGFGVREQFAAVKIQSNFRAYLSRRALRALKALVKLQALVRGHIVRKQTADMMRRMQALIRAQARARAGRSQIAESPSQSSIKTSHFHHPAGPLTPEKFEQAMRVKSKKYDQPSMLKRNGSKAYAARPMADEEKSDKILEVDPGKPHRRRNLFQSSEQNSHSHSYSLSFTTSRGSTIQQTVASPSHSGEVNSQFYPFTNFETEDVSNFCTADNSPQFYSASSVRGPFTPTKSDASRSCLSGYSDHPNYMAYTESSRAKVRSMSAPKQRPQFEVSNVTNTKRYSVYGYGDSRSGVQRGSVLRDGFVGKAYPGSGRLDRLGMPVVGDVGKLDGGYWNRY